MFKKNLSRALGMETTRITQETVEYSIPNLNMPFHFSQIKWIIILQAFANVEDAAAFKGKSKLDDPDVERVRR
jgi:hypothetical protein